MTKNEKGAVPGRGYLVGGLVQLSTGVALIGWSFLGNPPASGLFGLFLTLLGVRSLVKYLGRNKGRAGGGRGTS